MAEKYVFCVKLHVCEKPRKVYISIRDCFSLYWETRGVADSVLRKSCIPNTTRSGNMKQNSSQLVFFFLWDMRRLTWSKRFLYPNKCRKKKSFCETQTQKSHYTHPFLDSKAHTWPEASVTQPAQAVTSLLDLSCRVSRMSAGCPPFPASCSCITREGFGQGSETRTSRRARRVMEQNDPHPVEKKRIKPGTEPCHNAMELRAAWKLKASGKHAGKPHFHNQGNRSPDISSGSCTGSIMHSN